MTLTNPFRRTAPHPVLSGSYQEIPQLRLPVIEKRMEEILESRIDGEYRSSHDWIDSVGKSFDKNSNMAFSYVSAHREWGVSPSHRDHLVSVVVQSDVGRLSFDVLNGRFFNPIAKVYDSTSAAALSDVCERFLLQVALYRRAPNPADELFPVPQSREPQPRRSGIMIKA